LQARWGCVRAGLKPHASLPIDLAEVAEDHERVTGVARCGACPFSRSLTPWALQILRASRLGGEEPLQSFRRAIGREPHTWDVAALDVLAITRADVRESDDAIRERERKNKTST
jgi:hypothetical protein